MTKLFSVVDIETNGGFAKNGKITEIAIFVTDGEKIISEFCSLINPESYIPPFIQNLTGITNEMVEDAPKFYEIAKNIVEITKDTVFVAHNAKFDYGFIQHEFAQLGYDFNLETLCTLTLSRRLLKGYKSYSLGNLCNDLGIILENRHRAFGDARATVDLLNLIIKYDYENFEGYNINGFPIKGINKNFDLSKVSSIPTKYGIYYFYNSDAEVIFLKKAKNINSDILSFFRNKKNEKIKSQIVDIDYELTGCELISKLKEFEETSKFNSTHNKKTKISNKWGIYTYEDKNGYQRFCIDTISCNNKILLSTYMSKKIAEDFLVSYCIKYKLCQKLCGLYDSAGACFYHGLGECYGACCGLEAANDYNTRADKFINDIYFNLKDAFIIIENCDNNRTGVIALKNYKYIGYGFIDKNYNYRLEDIDDCIKLCNDNNDSRQIIFTYLKNNNNYKLVNYSNPTTQY